MLVFQLCLALNACTKNIVLILCGTLCTRRNHSNNEKAPKARWVEGAGEANTQQCDTLLEQQCWCFVEQTSPRQIARKRAVLVLFGPNETTAITKKHQNTESTGEANTQHCNTMLKPMCSKKQLWCILVLRRTDEPTAICTKKQSAGAFWCFVEQTKPQHIEKAPKE